MTSQYTMNNLTTHSHTKSQSHYSTHELRVEVGELVVLAEDSHALSNCMFFVLFCFLFVFLFF